ncbi:MAG TPA: hypothetical protein VI522_07140, partial [Gammaproteobacteria bacterium]|nr:hypothetical protein [Gammaproteobacteria bacterium]
MHKIMSILVWLFFPIHLAVAQSSLFAYITNAATPSYLSMCPIDTVTGQFKTCQPMFLDHLSTPIGVALATLDATTYAYISNNNYPNEVLRCVVGDEGHLHACALTGVPAYTGIAIHKSDALYAYLAYSNSVEKCRLSKNGELSQHACEDSGAGQIFNNGPIYMRFITFNAHTYVYIANGDYQRNASVIQCRVTAAGDFTACKDAGAGATFNGAADVDFAHSAGRTYAYVTEP